MSREVAGSPLPEARRRRILEMVSEGAVVRTADIADHLGVTMITVRRDIDALATEGRVRRVHGGVARAGAAARDETSVRGIGILVPALDYYWPEVVRGAEAVAQRFGGRVMVSGPTVAGAEIDALHRLHETGVVDALLVAPDPAASDRTAVLAALDELGVPIVLLERDVDVSRSTHIDVVRTDYALGVSLARRHLSTLGHESVALVTSEASPHADEIIAAWSDGGPVFTVPARVEASWRSGIAAVVDALRSARTTAVLVHSDHEAVALAQEAARQGLSLPEDLSLVAYDDQLASLFDPALTAVHPYPRAIGEAAVEAAVERLIDPSRPARRVVISPSLVVRASTAIRQG